MLNNFVSGSSGIHPELKILITWYRVITSTALSKITHTRTHAHLIVWHTLWARSNVGYVVMYGIHAYK